VILRTIVVTLLLVTAMLLQTALFPFLSLAGFRPDLLLLVVVGVALHDGSMAGVRVGFAAGLLSDLLATEAQVGLAALVYSGIGFVIGFARPYLAPESFTAPLIAAFLAGLFGTAGYGVLTLLLGDERVTFFLLLQASLLVALYNTLLAPIVLGVVERLTDRFPLGGSSLLDRP
jgi:rod shape-determining protein MreD